MKILKIIHGYPPTYNAGSEVYSQLLCLELAKSHDVQVFTREENPFAADFTVRKSHDSLNPTIKLNIINIPLERQRYAYRQSLVDTQIGILLDEYRPDIVHIGHLNHLSTSMVKEIYQRNIPIIYTLHDYWLLCPRGQFIQRNAPANDLWALCDGQDNQKCARQCYAGYFSGSQKEQVIDREYWANWVQRRMTHIHQIVKLVDLFIAPSRYLQQRYQQDFAIPNEQIKYLDYGFDLTRLKIKKINDRSSGQPFKFGYIGTHIPAKGIQHLIQAFGQVTGDCELHIWGRPQFQHTAALKALTQVLPPTKHQRIVWQGEYTNLTISEKVFQHVDCIVVPSLWVENSPLVIHEALQAKVAVITANAGGMAEYIQHEINGLLFQHRDITSLTQQMQRLIDNPKLALTLGQRGYCQSPSCNVCSIEEHVRALESMYHTLIRKHKRSPSHDQRLKKNTETRPVADHL